MATVEEKTGESKQTARGPLHFLCREHSGVKTTTRWGGGHLLSARPRELETQQCSLRSIKSLFLTLSSRTGRHKEATEEHGRERGGRSASLGPNCPEATETWPWKVPEESSVIS